MKVSKYNQLYQLTLYPRVFPINCYLYEEQHECTLIDTGIPASFKGIVDLVRKLDKPLTNIILTHPHGDHVGSLDLLKEHFPKATVSISERDNRLLQGDMSLDKNEPQTPIKGGFNKKLKTTADQLLKEGDQIGSLTVIETPGHTPGSISLWDSKKLTIIVGDAMQTKGKIAISGQLVPLFPFPALATWNKEISLESVKKIYELKPTLLAVGHGKIIENPNNFINEAIINAERKLVNV